MFNRIRTAETSQCSSLLCVTILITLFIGIFIIYHLSNRRIMLLIEKED